MIGFILLILFSNSSASSQTTKWRFEADKMGSPFTITIHSTDSLQAKHFATSSLQLVDSLVHIFSDYDSSSEVSFINQHAASHSIPISPLMEELLIIAQDAFVKSGGTYNIAIGPLSQLWRSARANKQFPTKEQVETTKNDCHFKDLFIDTLNHTILFKKKGMRLDFGGLGKGFIGQKIIDYLKSNGIHNCMIDAGGKIETASPSYSHEKWKIGINKLESKSEILPRIIQLKNEAIASSGAIYQFYIYKGKKYGHIINPNTGYGITQPKNVTVIAQNGVVADWLATACSILPVDKAMKLIKDMHAEGMIVVQEKNKIKYYKSSQFESYF
jgi:thiamine biosynthesis lipoprotein